MKKKITAALSFSGNALCLCVFQSSPVNIKTETLQNTWVMGKLGAPLKCHDFSLLHEENRKIFLNRYLK